MDRPATLRGAVEKFTELKTIAGVPRGQCPFCVRARVFCLGRGETLWYCLGCSRGGDLDDFGRMLKEAP